MTVDAPRRKPEETTVEARHRGPGPGRYMLPSTLGYKEHDITKYKQPAHSFGMKLESGLLKTCQHSPGPIYAFDSMYTKHGKDGSPHFSIYGRIQPLTVQETPSPATYFSERVPLLHERKAPKYSMLSRQRYRQNDFGPAPNSYSLPSMLGRVPHKAGGVSYSFGCRTKICELDRSSVPGSAHYKVVSPNVYRTRAPAHLLGRRVFMPEDMTVKPGPGTYYPEKVTINRPKAPGFSGGVRHSDYITPLITREDQGLPYEVLD